MSAPDTRDASGRMRAHIPHGARRGARPIIASARIIAPQSLARAILADCASAPDRAAARTRAAQRLAAAREEGQARLAAAFAERPLASRAMITAQSRLTDGLIRAALVLARELCREPHLSGRGSAPDPRPEPERERGTGPQPGLTLIAVGGYGRAEMAPRSDADFMILSPGAEAPGATPAAETLLYLLWDAGLRIGHATRSIADCLADARADLTIRTALLETRLVAGDMELARTLDARLWDELFSTTGPEFIEGKLAERAARHARQGGQRYMLEPNVKEGKGGLRDLQTLYWIGKYLYRVPHAEGLIDTGLFSRAEYATFRRAEDFLWSVRCHLHLVTGRATERLGFELQPEVAARMGYRDGGGRRAVEVFMQDYFRHATRVGELTRIFLTGLEAKHLRRADHPARGRSRRRPGPGLRIREGRIDVADPDSFLADPLNLLRLFEEGLRTGHLLHPDAMRLVAANLDRIDDTVRNSREAGRLFLGLLLGHGNPERALRRMNETGLLAAFIPEFEPIVAMMQFNVYHHYTVDEHTIQCISTLAQIERGELDADLPVSSAILRAGVNRRVLYVALLLHDIGKGREEDHSILGARIARRVAPRLGLGASECETVEWLVRNHLVMSDMAQKRDISDPRTVQDFARAVATRSRLDLLTLLTVCDIRGVGPDTWNNWKAVLLRRLHAATAEALAGGIEARARRPQEAEARRALREVLAGWDAKALRDELARHDGAYWQGLPPETHVVFARLLLGITPGDTRIDLHPDPARDATRVCFALADRPGIFSRLAGALALVGADVRDARTYTTRDGYATAVFWVQDSAGRPYEADRLPRLHQKIAAMLHEESSARAALRDRDRPRPHERAFRFPTHVTFDNDASDDCTVIEVDTRDRPGLLHDLTRVLAASRISIRSAVIATYGAQVVDSFYVTGPDGAKLAAGEEREALEKALRAVIAAGFEQASS